MQGKISDEGGHLFGFYRGIVAWKGLSKHFRLNGTNGKAIDKNILVFEFYSE